MRLELACVILGAILLARGDARPQQIETNKTAIPEVKKEIVHGIIDDAKKEKERSRYRSSSISSQNINQFNNNNNKLYYNNNNFTSGIISRNEKSSRRSKLPQNWTIKSSNNSTKLQNNNNNIQLLDNNYSGFKTEKINLRNIAKISIINDELPLNHKKINAKNSNKKISVIKTTTTTTTRAPTVVKNLVVIRPVTFSSSSPFFDSNKKPPPIKSFIKINQTVNNNLSNVKKTQVKGSPYLKNWPNEPLNTIQDFINYEKYTHIEDDDITKKPLTTTTNKPIRQNNINNKYSEQNQVTNYREPLSHPNVQEIIQWLQIPPFAPISNNQSTISQEFKPGQSFSNAFEPGFDERFVTEGNPSLDFDPTEESFTNAPIPNEPDYDDDLFSSNLPTTLATPSSPSTLPPPPPPPQTTNNFSPPDNSNLDFEPNKKRPIFRPISEVSQNTVVHIINPLSKIPNTSMNNNNNNPSTQKPPPNVHIMFMPSNNNSNEEEQKHPAQKFNQTDCPTIMINSITKINNTIQSKEGCTDLNIIINSQVLSTNNFDAGGFDDNGTDKFSNSGLTSSASPDDGEVENNYPNKHFGHWGESSSVEPVELETPEPPVEPVKPEEQQPEQGVAEENNESNEDASPFDVNQETDIEYVGSDSAEAEFSDGGSAGQSIGSSGGGGPGSIASNLPSIGNQISGLAGSGGPGDSTALTTINSGGGNEDDDDDDDDDDIFGLTTSSVLDGVTSIFTYLTVLNPLNYGIFSVAAAPFAALAAGVLGVGAMFFPWAFSSGFDFGRASDRVTIRFTPNIEEVVRQSIYDYKSNWGEWKSRRKKSKRR